MIKGMANIAAECIRMPGRTSVWSKAAGKYVCATDPEYKQAVAEHTPAIAAAHPPINPATGISHIGRRDFSFHLDLRCLSRGDRRGYAYRDAKTRRWTVFYGANRLRRCCWVTRRTGVTRR